jgi:Sulfotransferase domain
VRLKPVAKSSVLPNFVVIGAMRSGSTSLYKYLQAHPDVFMPRKEIHFFDRKWDRGLSWYLSRFEGHSGQPAVGEATPTYLAEPNALDRMASTIPDARLLAVLRDPVDRAYSHYWMEHARDRDPRTFEEAIADELTGRPGAPDYLARGRYVRQLEDVGARFPRPQLRVVLFDDLRDRPHETYAGVCRFLGIDDRFVPPRLGERVNRYVEFRSIRMRRVRRRLPSTWGIGRIVGRLNAREGPYPPMDSGTRADLRRHFAPEIAALAAWLERDLSVWA